MSSHLISEPAFRDLVSSAAIALAKVAQQANEDPHNNTLALTTEDAIGRFQLWAGNIGALQLKNSPKSLDHRLRDAPQIRNNVRVALERLEDTAQRVASILAGELPNRIDNGDGMLEITTGEPVDELHELFESIKSSINTLFRLSMLIRRHRPRGKLPGDNGTDDPPPPDDPLDTRHVCDMFPHVKTKPWLAARLGRAITKRREYIRSREKHRKSLAKAPDCDNCTIPNSGTVATTFVGDHIKQDDSQAKAYSILTSATSFLSVATNGQDIGEAIPDLSDMVLDDVQLDYGEPFECPFCRTIQTMEDRGEWKKHVFFDLQPYVCTFEDCNVGLFESRHEWWKHEMDAHRQIWCCVVCPPSAAASGSKQEMEKHLQTSHSNVLTEAQVPGVLGTCRAPTDVDSSECPLCPDWPTLEMPIASKEKGLARHLARHLQQLALASVPVHIEGLKIRQPDESRNIECDNLTPQEGQGNDEGWVELIAKYGRLDELERKHILQQRGIDQETLRDPTPRTAPTVNRYYQVREQTRQQNLLALEQITQQKELVFQRLLEQQGFRVTDPTVLKLLMTPPTNLDTEDPDMELNERLQALLSKDTKLEDDVPRSRDTADSIPVSEKDRNTVISLIKDRPGIFLGLGIDLV